MAIVTLTDDARNQFDELPGHIRARLSADVFPRLERWPDVSGAKPLRGDMTGSFRIRTGSYRVVFKPSADATRVTGIVRVWKIGNRKDVYLD